MSPDQCRAARIWLKLSQTRLAAKVKIRRPSTIRGFRERPARAALTQNMEAIPRSRAFEVEGVPELYRRWHIVDRNQDQETRRLALGGDRAARRASAFVHLEQLLDDPRHPAFAVGNSEHGRAGDAEQFVRVVRGVARIAPASRQSRAREFILPCSSTAMTNPIRGQPDIRSTRPVSVNSGLFHRPQH